MDIELAQALKENAELKNKLEHRNCIDCSNHSSKLRMRTLELEQGCTKAKEIIKTFLGFAEAFGYSPSMDKFIKEAEQFLIEPDDRFEVTEKGKEYLSSH